MSELCEYPVGIISTQCFGADCSYEVDLQPIGGDLALVFLGERNKFSIAFLKKIQNDLLTTILNFPVKNF